MILVRLLRHGDKLRPGERRSTEMAFQGRELKRLAASARLKDVVDAALILEVAHNDVKSIATCE